MKNKDHFSNYEICRRTGLSRNTVRKWLNSQGESPIKYIRKKVPGKLSEFTDVLDQAIQSDSTLGVNKRRNGKALLTLIQEQGYQGGYSAVTEYIRRKKDTTIIFNSPVSKENSEKQRWMDWIYKIERNDLPIDIAGDIQFSKLSQIFLISVTTVRRKILTVLAYKENFSTHFISKHLAVSRNTVRRNVTNFHNGGCELLLSRKSRTRIADQESFKKTFFALLHEPPSLSEFNRTTWRIVDLQTILSSRGFTVGRSIISEAIKKSGFKWKSAKVVLTSNDPEYREKLNRVQDILSSLKNDERFFSIDEFGPFAIKAKPGRMLVEAGASPSVPQWQKSKGWLIATAALELSENQVTHFYSRAKNTKEMIKMVNLLIEKYLNTKKLYISWDAASWHMSKELISFVDKRNASCLDPGIELVPLPASAQFLNVIESVFSGMSKAIIHSSDYQSVQHASDAIDRYFAERNKFFQKNPKRAGNKIWGKERVKSVFDSANNCKDPAYR